MQYLMLIYQNETEMDAAPKDASRKMSDDYLAFTRDIVQSGHFKAGNALHRTASSTCVRVRDGKTLVTDGPFAETREQLNGYYLVDASDLDAASAIAARIPGAKAGCIEIRPVVVFG